MRKRFQNFVYIFIFILSLVLLQSCADKKVANDEIAADWDGGKVSAGELKELMETAYGNKESARKQPVGARYDLLNRHIEEQLLIAEAKQIGIPEKESLLNVSDLRIHTFKSRVQEVVDRKAAEVAYNTLVENKFFTKDRLQNFLDHDREEVHVSHILIAVPEGISGTDTLEYWKKADEIYEKAKSGQNFDKLADRYSDDNSIPKSRHGDLGFINWGRMVDPFQEAAWKLEPGEVSKPARTSFGYHIIKLHDRRSHWLELNTSHILISCPLRAHPAETTAAYDRAMMVLEKAKEPGADFSELARSYSEDEQTWTNGSLGFLTRNGMPQEYWDAALTLDDGEVGGPARTRYGYHIIKVNDRRLPEKSISDPDVKKEIIAKMTDIYREEIQQAATAVKDSVQKLYNTEYNWQNIQKAADRTKSAGKKEFEQWADMFSANELGMKLIEDDFDGLTLRDLTDNFKNYHEWAENVDKLNISQMAESIQWVKYLADLAKRMNIFEHPDVVAERESIQDAVMAREMNATEMITRIPITDSDTIRSLYERDKEWYSPKENPRSFEEARHQIEMDFRYRQWDEKRAQWIAELWNKYQVVINDDVVQNIYPTVEPLSEIVANERRNLRKKRKELAEEIRKQDQLKVRLKPGTTQTFTKDGKEYKVKIGKPIYREKGKEIDPQDADVKLTPKGKLEKQE